MVRRAHIGLALLLFLLVGCQARQNEKPGEKPGEKRTLTDALGRKVEIGQTRRVVSLAPSATEVVFVAGGGSRLVGVSTVDDYPPQVRSLPKYSIFPVSIESIVALHPDLALASGQISGPRDAETLGALGVPTFFLPSSSLSDVYTSIRMVGELLGTREQARRAIDSLRTRADSIRTLTKPLPNKPRVLVLISEQPLYAFGRESYVHEIVAMAGGRSITGEMNVAQPVLTDEYVLTARPDVIVGTFGKTYDPKRLLELHPTWADVPAIRNHRVYTVEESYLQRPGPRLVEAAWILARQFHPDLFRNP